MLKLIPRAQTGHYPQQCARATTGVSCCRGCRADGEKNRQAPPERLLPISSEDQRFSKMTVNQCFAGRCLVTFHNSDNLKFYISGDKLPNLPGLIHEIWMLRPKIRQQKDLTSPNTLHSLKVAPGSLSTWATSLTRLGSKLRMDFIPSLVWLFSGLAPAASAIRARVCSSLCIECSQSVTRH